MYIQHHNNRLYHCQRHSRIQRPCLARWRLAWYTDVLPADGRHVAVRQLEQGQRPPNCQMDVHGRLVYLHYNCWNFFDGRRYIRVYCHDYRQLQRVWRVGCLVVRRQQLVERARYQDISSLRTNLFLHLHLASCSYRKFVHCRSESYQAPLRVIPIKGLCCNADRAKQCRFHLVSLPDSRPRSDLAQRYPIPCFVSRASGPTETRAGKPPPMPLDHRVTPSISSHRIWTGLRVGWYGTWPGRMVEKPWDPKVLHFRPVGLSRG